MSMGGGDKENMAMIAYNSENSHALKDLMKSTGKKRKTEDGEEDGAAVIGRNINFMDLQEKRIQNFAKSLIIYEDIFQPFLLWNYLDTYATGTDIRNYDLVENDDDDDMEAKKEKDEENNSSDWLCTNCSFANPLDNIFCDVCEMERVYEEFNDDVAEVIASASWFVDDALSVPFRPLIVSD